MEDQKQQLRLEKEKVPDLLFLWLHKYGAWEPSMQNFFVFGKSREYVLFLFILCVHFLKSHSVTQGLRLVN